MAKPKSSPILTKLRKRIIAAQNNKSGSRDPVAEGAAAICTALKGLGSLVEGTPTLMEQLAGSVDEPTRDDFLAALGAIKTLANQALAALGGEKAQTTPSSAAKVLSLTSTAYGRLNDTQRREFLRQGGKIVPTNHTPRRWGANP